MCIIERKKSFEEFFQYNQKYIEENIILNIFLYNSIHQVFSNPEIVYDYFNINKNDKTIIVLLVKDICLIYGNLESDQAILLLEKELKFEKFKRYNFAGNRNILKKLLNNTGSEYSTVKYLSIYKCSKLKRLIEIDVDKIQLITIDEIDLLHQLLKQFHSEFYEGYSEDNLPSIKTLKKSVLNRNYFKYVDNNKIKGIGNLLNRYGFPELSLVFTQKEERNKNIGTYLAYYITAKALKTSDFIMLYTKGDNITAKKMFEKIGYINTGEYTMFYKEK